MKYIAFTIAAFGIWIGGFVAGLYFDQWLANRRARQCAKQRDYYDQGGKDPGW